MLHNHTLICPWHHACFDIRTGNRTEPPALDNIASYPVYIEQGQVYVELEPVETPTPRQHAAGETFVVIGGGAAGQAAAETLREQGFAGELIMLSAVNNLPIDRPNVSKDYLAGEAKPEWMPLRDMDWYKQHNIDLRLNSRVIGLDTDALEIYLEDGPTVYYDKLLIATGGRPKTLDSVPAADLQNIFTLCTQTDADRIINELGDAENVVVIGTGFIGMEVAASLGQRGANVVVIGPDTVPLETPLGNTVGAYIQQVHEQYGVQFHMGTAVARFGGTSTVEYVELTDGTRLPTELVVVGIGVTPATDFLVDTKIALNTDNHAVLANKQLQTSASGVYVAGDVASYTKNGDQQRQQVEHWRAAQQQGTVAAQNMLEDNEPITAHVPFFWTAQWDLKLKFVGHTDTWNKVVYRGNPNDGAFIAFYLQDGQLVAACASGFEYEQDMGALEFILKHNIALTAQQMQDPDFDLVALSQARSTTNGHQE